MKISFITSGGGGGVDTNTNVALDNLAMTSGSKTTDVGVNTLTFDSGTTNIIQLVGSDDTLNIGGASPYKMPTARASATNEVLISTNGTGGLEFDSISGVGGYCMMMSGHGGATWAADSYGFMRKDGGNMFIDVNLTVSASGAQQTHMFTWNGRLIPNAYKIVGQRTSSGAIGGINCDIYYNTPNTLASNIVWTQGENIFGGFLAADSSVWEVGSGVIDPSAFDLVSDGDFLTFAFQSDQTLADCRLWLTLYFDNTVS